MEKIETWVEIYDPNNDDMVWKYCDSLKEAKHEMRIWNLDKLGYRLRWVAAVVKNSEYWVFAYADTEKEIKEEVKKWSYSKS